MTESHQAPEAVSEGDRDAGSGHEAVSEATKERSEVAGAASARGPGIPVRSERDPELRLLHLQFDVDAGRQVESLEGLDGLAGRLDDVDEALVNAHLEVLAAVLVDMR